MHACMYICMHACIYVYICMYVCMYIYIYTYIYIYIDTYVYIYIYIYIYIYVYIYIYAVYMHTDTSISTLLLAFPLIFFFCGVFFFAAYNKKSYFVLTRTPFDYLRQCLYHTDTDTPRGHQPLVCPLQRLASPPCSTQFFVQCLRLCLHA
jgi:hypothetical protein